MATHAHLQQNIARCKEMSPFCENPVCPDPVWKPLSIASGRSSGRAGGRSRGGRRL